MCRLLRQWSIVTRRFSIEVGKVLCDSPELIHPLVWRSSAQIDQPSTAFLGKLTELERKHLEFVQKEVELFSHLTPMFPRRFDDKSWGFLLDCQTRKQRYDHVVFMRRKEVLREKSGQKQRERREREVEQTPVPWKPYINWNTARVLKEQKRGASNRAVTAYLLRDRPSLAVDCRFLEKMSPRGANLTAAQLNFLVSSNKYQRTPWPLYFVNFDQTAPTTSNVASRHLALLEGETNCSPIATSQNYTSLFARDKIIYLSPHAEEELTDLAEDDVLYVLGGIVDRVPEKGIHPHASRVTAEADGVRCARLPLERFIKWKSGTKYLTLVAVANILHDVHTSGGDWEQALARHIPVRNTREADEKNRISKDLHTRIRNFNRELLRVVNEQLPEETGSEPKVDVSE